MKGNDINDQLRAGSMPQDPLQGTTVSDDAPHILTVRDLLQGSLQRVTSRSMRPHGTSGHHKLDEVTGGLRAGDVWLCGADTSWGKSSFAVMLADENIKRGKRVLIVSAEDSEATYGDRLLRRRSRVGALAMRHRRLSPGDYDAMAAVVAKGEPLPVFIDARGKTVEWLAPRCKRAIAEHDIDIVVFDYVGAFAAKLGQQDRRNIVTYIGRVLTDVAKTAKPGGVAGVLLSQITHADPESVPGKYSIRDSKDLVQMSEVTLIGFIAPKNMTGKGPNGRKDTVANKGDRCITLAKVKEGPAGSVLKLAWNQEVACFDAVLADDLDHDERRTDESLASDELIICDNEQEGQDPSTQPATTPSHVRTGVRGRARVEDIL
jgi:replicative DNA helicase